MTSGRLQFPPAPLEDWLRHNYFTAEISICSSGVEPYSVRELRALTGMHAEALDELVLDDGYSYGTPEVRDAVARRWGDGDPDKVITTCGSNEALALITAAVAGAGDEVVVVEPGYHALIGHAASLGCRLRTWRLELEDDFRPSLPRLEELVTARTRAIIVNFPHNPTGTSMSHDEMKQLLNLADRHGIYVIWDEAFTDISYDTPRLPAVCTVYDRAISIGTMSKSYGLPGLRFGWCIADPVLLARCVHLRDYSTLHVSPVIELLALKAVENIDALLTPRAKQARTNRELLRRWAADRSDQVRLVMPTGGVAAFPRLEGIANADAFAQRLFEEYRVLVVPGSCFGCPPHLRIGFGGATDELAAGLDRLGDALDTFL